MRYIVQNIINVKRVPSSSSNFASRVFFFEKCCKKFLSSALNDGNLTYWSIWNLSVEDLATSKLNEYLLQNPHICVKVLGCFQRYRKKMSILSESINDWKLNVISNIIPRIYPSLCNCHNSFWNTVHVITKKMFYNPGSWFSVGIWELALTSRSWPYLDHMAPCGYTRLSFPH